GRPLCVANEISGTLSLIDLETRQVVSEQKVGERLSGLVRREHEDSDLLLVTDQAAHELLVVRQRGELFEVRQRTPVARHPVSVAVSPDRTTVAVAGLWSRRVTLLSASELNAAGEAEGESDSQISDLKAQTAGEV